MTDDDYLYAVLNCDDTSGEATDAAARAVYRLRVRAEKAEATIARVRELHRGSPECAHCAGVKALPVCASELVDTCDACCEVIPCPTIRVIEGAE